jgi:hypothetical protein
MSGVGGTRWETFQFCGLSGMVNTGIAFVGSGMVFFSPLLSSSRKAVLMFNR